MKSNFHYLEPKHASHYSESFKINVRYILENIKTKEINYEQFTESH